MQHGKVLGAALVSLAVAEAGSAQAVAQRPPAVQRVLDCRKAADNTARLACYDLSVPGLETSTAVDRGAVLAGRKQASRKSFGLADRPTSAERAQQAEAEVREIDTEVASARADQEGHWIITLKDGGVWKQADDTVVARAPRPGAKVRIVRGALGSFRVRIGEQPSFKARRIS